jgi:hypothetical protein
MTAVVHRHRLALLALAASVAVVALAWLGSVPTGTDSAAATVGPGARLAATAEVDDVEVLLAARGGALSVHVAYPTAKGWLSVALPAAPSTAVAAWAATDGTGPIPALSVVYGRASGATAVVRWADGEETTVPLARDGVYLAVRQGRVASDTVRILDTAGTAVLDVDGLRA